MLFLRDATVPDSHTFANVRRVWFTSVCRMTPLHTTTLNDLLAARQITGKALANAIGATESQVSNYRRGLRPTPPRAKQMSDALGLSDDELAALGWDVGEVK